MSIIPNIDINGRCYVLSSLSDAVMLQEMLIKQDIFIFPNPAYKWQIYKRNGQVMQYLKLIGPQGEMHNYFENAEDAIAAMQDIANGKIKLEVIEMVEEYHQKTPWYKVIWQSLTGTKPLVFHGNVRIN